MSVSVYLLIYVVETLINMALVRLLFEKHGRYVLLNQSLKFLGLFHNYYMCVCYICDDMQNFYCFSQQTDYGLVCHLSVTLGR